MRKLVSTPTNPTDHYLPWMIYSKVNSIFKHFYDPFAAIVMVVWHVYEVITKLSSAVSLQ